MKGFTLVEFAVTIFILMILLTIVVSFNSFNRNFFYLKEFSRKLNNAFGIANFLAQQTKSYGNDIICAYGIYFPNNRSYETLAFATSTLVCDYVVNTDLQNFLNSNLSNKKYVHSNLEIRNVPIEKLVLKDELKGGNIVFSTSEGCTPNLSSPLIFMYVYSYTDMYFIYQRGAGGRWERIVGIPSVYLCLNFRNESVKIKINQIGQFYIIE